MIKKNISVARRKKNYSRFAAAKWVWLKSVEARFISRLLEVFVKGWVEHVNIPFLSSYNIT